jgi:hypothetical protein
MGVETFLGRVEKSEKSELFRDSNFVLRVFGCHQQSLCSPVGRFFEVTPSGRAWLWWHRVVARPLPVFSEQSFHEPIRVERLKVVHLLSNPYIRKGNPKAVAYADNDPPFCSAVQFCKDNAGNLNGLMEELCL